MRFVETKVGDEGIQFVFLSAKIVKSHTFDLFSIFMLVWVLKYMDGDGNQGRILGI